MNTFPGTRQHTEIRVADRTYSGTRLTQMARFVSQTSQQANDGQYSVRIQVRVTMHADESGQVGPPLVAAGFEARLVTLTADNDTILNADGSLFATRQRPAQSEADWQQVCANAPADAFFQGDYFEYVSKNQPVVFDELIRQHLQAADQPPYSRFA